MKRLIALLLTLVLALSAGLIPAWAAEVPSDPMAIANPNAVGYSAANILAYPTDGLTDIKDYDATNLKDAYQITDADGLVKLSQIVNGESGYTAQNFAGKAIVLAADLDMTGKTMNPIGYGDFGCEYSTWATIKNGVATPFQGYFYGNGHTIKNLTIKETYSETTGTYTTWGLFGEVSETVVRDLILDESCSVSSSFSTDSACGILVGFVGSITAKTTILNCFVAGSVTGKQNVGAIAGRQIGSVEIAYCSTSPAMYGTLAVGGVIGYSGAVTIKNCLSTGSVTGKNPAWIGGVIGWLPDAGTTIENCTIGLSGITTSYHAANLAVGGLIGRCHQASTTLKTNTVYSLGTVNFTNANHTNTVAAPFVMTSGIGAQPTTIDGCVDLTPMMNISCQYVENAAGTEASLRVITALNNVDDYTEIGFEYKLADGTVVESKQVDMVFESIYANGAKVEPGDHFGTVANYFSTIVIDGIGSANYDTAICFRSYVVLADGTCVYGAWTSGVSINSLKNA